MKNNKKIKKREIEILELQTYGLVNDNPLHYYGTSICPLLFNGMFDAYEFLKIISNHFGWINFEFDGNITIKDRDLLVIKVLLTEGKASDVVNLYLDCYHSFSLPILPSFLYEIMEHIKKDAI